MCRARISSQSVSVRSGRSMAAMSPMRHLASRGTSGARRSIASGCLTARPSGRPRSWSAATTPIACMPTKPRRLGLTAGGHWKTLKDWPHVQLPPDASPLASLTVLDIDAAMEAGFGG